MDVHGNEEEELLRLSAEHPGREYPLGDGRVAFLGRIYSVEEWQPVLDAAKAAGYPGFLPEAGGKKPGVLARLFGKGKKGG